MNAAEVGKTLMIIPDDELQVGDRIRVVIKHWLRSLEYGHIVEIDPEQGENCYKIEFKERLGGGIENKFLYMDERQFNKVKRK